MVDGHLFDILSMIAQKLRKSAERPFGGIQARSTVYNHPHLCNVTLIRELHSWWLLATFFNCPRLPKAMPNHSLLSKAQSGRNVSSTQSPLPRYFGKKTAVRHRSPLKPPVFLTFPPRFCPSLKHPKDGCGFTGCSCHV
jgi:hypothetical protein